MGRRGRREEARAGAARASRRWCLVHRGRCERRCVSTEEERAVTGRRVHQSGRRSEQWRQR
eukprot:1283033-Rhodomonas_salina.1